MKPTKRPSARMADPPKIERHKAAGTEAKPHLEVAPDLDKVPIIVHSHLRWDFVWQRPQQILSRLAVNHPVLFVEDPIDGDGPRLDISKTPQGVVRIVPVIRHCGELSTDEQCATTLPLLRAALHGHPLLQGRFASAVQWFYSPMTAPAFLNQFGTIGVVYDCMDELANFRFAPTDIVEREDLLLSRADVVFTGGYNLHRAKSARHSNVHFYGCGVDVDHFAKARAPETTIPEEIASLPRPILGYFGVIDERLDYALLAQLARTMANASVVMVGPLAKVQRAELPSLPNIQWLGQRPYSELPSLVKAFDICLMPFALDASTRYINPTKTLEYLAAGKRVVSTPVPDVLHSFSSVVDIADLAEGFVTAVQNALSDPNPERITQGIKRARLSSWDAVVSSMRMDMLGSISRPQITLRRSAVGSVPRSNVAPAGATFAVPSFPSPAAGLALDGGSGE
jgi:glycosyltransferase involved in cell wall biosynthesis